jgi:hypothetical protein
MRVWNGLQALSERLVTSKSLAFSTHKRLYFARYSPEQSKPFYSKYISSVSVIGASGEHFLVSSGITLS